MLIEFIIDKERKRIFIAAPLLIVYLSLFVKNLLRHFIIETINDIFGIYQDGKNTSFHLLFKE